MRYRKVGRTVMPELVQEGPEEDFGVCEEEEAAAPASGGGREGSWVGRFLGSHSRRFGSTGTDQGRGLANGILNKVLDHIQHEEARAWHPCHQA